MALPARDELLSLILATNDGFIPSEYPYVYAHRFIASYPEVIPANVQAMATQDTIVSTPARMAATILNLWAEYAGSTKEELAPILADVWLHRHLKRNTVS